jgi:transposase
MGTTKIKRYSESFKRQVVREYEEGASAHYLQQKYGIGGSATIKHWVQKYGKEGFRTEQVLICSPEDQPTFQQMEQRIRELEAALAEAVLEARMLAAIVEAAGEHFQTDLKKAFGSRP